eukprot:GHUV01017789.1.p1 GENE.GHUV01017789.1~~GHUV01017789.1.p1  ORF type:complete len:213 (+),score=87.26 GHUV01017789.1:924-1562(+)
MVERVTEVTTHRKYVVGDMSTIANMLKQQLAAQPPNATAGVYVVALDSHRPGNGYIAFGSGGAAANVHREYFTITPDGFFFRQRTLESVEHVISAFKSKPNFKKEQAAQQRHAQPGSKTDASTAAGGYIAQGYGVPGPPGGYAMPAAAGYGYAGQQQQYRPPGGDYQGPAPAAAAPGYGAPAAGYGGYSQPGGYQQGYQQPQQYPQGYSYGR